MAGHMDEEEMVLIAETRSATSKCLDYYRKDKAVVSEASDTDDDEAEQKLQAVRDVRSSSVISVTGHEVSPQDQSWNITLTVPNPAKVTKKKRKHRMALRDAISEETLGKIITICDKFEKNAQTVHQVYGMMSNLVEKKKEQPEPLDKPPVLTPVSPSRTNSSSRETKSDVTKTSTPEPHVSIAMLSPSDLPGCHMQQLDIEPKQHQLKRGNRVVGQTQSPRVKRQCQSRYARNSKSKQRIMNNDCVMERWTGKASNSDIEVARDECIRNFGHVMYLQFTNENLEKQVEARQEFCPNFSHLRRQQALLTSRTKTELKGRLDDISKGKCLNWKCCVFCMMEEDDVDTYHEPVVLLTPPCCADGKTVCKRCLKDEVNVSVTHLQEKQKVETFMSIKDKIAMPCFYRCKFKTSKKCPHPEVKYCHIGDNTDNCTYCGSRYLFYLYGYILDALLATNYHDEGKYRDILRKFPGSKPTLVHLYENAVRMWETGVEQVSDAINEDISGEDEEKTPTVEEAGEFSCYPCGVSLQNMETGDMATNIPQSICSLQMTAGGTSHLQIAEVVTTHANSSSMSTISSSPSTESYQNIMTDNRSTGESVADSVMETLSNIPNASVTELNGNRMLEQLQKDAQCTTDVVTQQLMPISSSFLLYQNTPSSQYGEHE